MKDLIVRELFWFVISFLIALIGSFLFLEFLALSSSEPEFNSLEKLFTLQMYLKINLEHLVNSSLIM